MAQLRKFHRYIFASQWFVRPLVVFRPLFRMLENIRIQDIVAQTRSKNRTTKGAGHIRNT